MSQYHGYQPHQSPRLRGRPGRGEYRQASRRDGSRPTVATNTSRSERRVNDRDRSRDAGVGSSGDQGTMFRGATEFGVTGGQFLTAEVQHIHITSPNPDLKGKGKQRSMDRSVRPTTSTQHDSQEVPYSAENYEGTETQAMLIRNPLENIKPRTSFEIYYGHMAVQRRGSALWIPEPSTSLPMEYRRKGVAIGDIGVISAFGSFDFLFNICVPRDHSINPDDLPEGFIAHSVSQRDIRRCSEFAADSYLSSASIKKSIREGDSIDLVFESSASEGAILMMPIGSNSEDLIGTGQFRQYVTTYGEDWYRYANNTRRWEVRNGDLRLVIGYDKTTAWGMATFSNLTAHGSPGKEGPCRLKFRPKEDGNVGKIYGWEHTGTAQVRAGPDPRQIQALRQGDPSQAGSEYENQTLFVRTMNVNLQDDVWKKLAFKIGVKDTSTANPEQHSFLPSGVRPFNNGPSPHPDQSSFQSGYQPRYHASPGGPLDIAARTAIEHPSKGINEMLLNFKPGGRMVVTTDDDWISVLTENDHVLPSTEELMRRIMFTSIISQEGGTIFLEKINGRDSGLLQLDSGTIMTAPPKRNNLFDEEEWQLLLEQEDETERSSEKSLAALARALAPYADFPEDGTFSSVGSGIHPAFASFLQSDEGTANKISGQIAEGDGNNQNKPSDDEGLIFDHPYVYGQPFDYHRGRSEHAKTRDGGESSRSVSPPATFPMRRNWDR